MTIESFFVSKTLDAVLRKINRIVSTESSKYIISKKNIEEALAFHITQVENWSSEIAFKDMQAPKATSRAYIPLDVYLTLSRQKMSASSESVKIPIKELFKKTSRNIVILGQPGAGKTTTTKYVCQLIMHGDSIDQTTRLPLVIRLRELVRSGNANAETILERVFETLGLMITLERKIKEKDKDKATTQTKIIQKEDVEQFYHVIIRVVSELMDELGVCLILDGLDELPANLRDRTISEVKSLCLSFTKARIILTSRLGEFHYNIDNTIEYEICPLTVPQIQQFADKWLNKRDAKVFIAELKKSPFADTAIRPLTLAHLLAIYEREQQIPEKPKTVYKKIINLLLDEWDLQRSIQRKSRYGNFEVDRKQEFLANMAYYLTTKLRKTIFTKDEFENAYREICENFDLPKFESRRVADEIESHNGLFIQTGYESYEFAHKSLQEYLTADYLVKLPFIPLDRELLSMGSEMALCVAISSNPTNYFVTLVFQFLSHYPGSHNFVNTLLNRLIIEKVDFNQHPILAVAFLKLYSDEKDTWQKGNSEVRYRLSDVYEKMHNLNSIKLSLIKLKEYYEIIGNYDGIDDVFELKNLRFLPNQIITNLPKKLYADKLFLLNWE